MLRFMPPEGKTMRGGLLAGTMACLLLALEQITTDTSESR